METKFKVELCTLRGELGSKMDGKVKSSSCCGLFGSTRLNSTEAGN